MIYVFGDYELDTSLYELRQGGNALRVEPKVFDLLTFLVQHRDSVVSKDDLFHHIWPEQYISEATLSGCVMAARKAVSDSGRKQQIIQTVHGRGYRFVASVEERIEEISDEEVQAVPGLQSAAEPRIQGHEEISSRFEHEEAPVLIRRITPSGPSVITCHLCEHSNSVNAMFCVACGARLFHTCSGCGQISRLPASFCPVCGQQLEKQTIPPEGKIGTYAHSQFVGRQRELAVLHELLGQARHGHGQVAVLIGASGIGKSWLLNEFHQRLESTQVTYLEACCPSYGVFIPYLPLSGIIRQYIGISDEDTPDVTVAKVFERLQELRMEPEAAGPYLAHLLGASRDAGHLTAMSPETARIQTFATLRQMLLACSRIQPLMIVIEDFHWADITSRNWIASFIDMLATAPILLLISTQPEYKPAWLGKPCVTEVSLAPLNAEDSVRVIHSILPQEKMGAILTQTVVDKAAGHPFLLVALAESIAEQVDLDLGIVVPDTIQELLMMRLDRLPEVTQRLLQTASVLGPAFSLRLLQATWEGPGTLAPYLLELERRGLCCEQSGSVNSVYAFKHALIQEAAYQSLPAERRHSLHAAVGEVLETFYTDCLQDHAGLLAYHYGQSDLTDKAIDYLSRLAARCERLFAYEEAVMALREALARVEHQSAGEPDLRQLNLILQQARCLLALGHSQAVVSLLRAQQTALEQLQESGLSGHSALLLGQAFGNLRQWEQVPKYAHRAVTASTSCRDEVTTGQAYHLLATERYWAGQPLEGIDFGRRAIALLEPSGECFRVGMAYFVLGLNGLMCGDFEPALEAESQAVAIGEATKDLHLRALSTWATGWIHATRGDIEAAIAACQRSLDLSPDPINTAFAQGWLGYAYLEKCDPIEACSHLEQAMGYMRQFDYRRFQGLYTILLGEAYLLEHDADKAHDLVQQGLTLSTAEDFQFGIAWSHRTLGKIASARGALVVARRYFHQALDTFTGIPARFEVGRTHLALAYLAQNRAHRRVAARHVMQAYECFQASRVPKYMQHATRCAAELGMSLH